MIDLAIPQSDTTRPTGMSPEARTVDDNCYRSALLFFTNSIFTERLRSERIQLIFKAKKAEWLRDTRFISDSNKIFSNPSYQAILELGAAALPFIIQDMKNTNNHWFFALKKITNQNPVKAEHIGNISLMKQDWLEWLHDNFE
ncbi:hypothetical protein [Leptospira interrogans]|uniref:hypothetical protein n=1 Tax=Leptospira interrogans TaxID=173 RepID=UPI00177D88E4|nr:hypothetical protein [Leptospira interrogans]MBE0305268.1 hypothetical protein [Leptospira interrogans serovar Yeoncheon]